MAHTNTVVKTKRLSKGGGVAIVTVDTTSLAAGGEAFTAAELKAMGIASVDHIQCPAKIGQYEPEYDYGTGKIRFFKSGAAEVVDEFRNIKGGETADITNGNNTTDPVNGAYVLALTNFVTTAISAGITNPDVARNLFIQVRSATGGTMPADCGNATLIGTDGAGAAQTEVKSLAALNGITLAAGGEIGVVTTKMFKTLTSIQFSVDLEAGASPDDIQVAVGLGTKIYLRKGPLFTPAEADISQVQKNLADVAAATYVADTTYNGLEMGANLADNDDVIVYYKAGKVEAAAATNVGAGRFLVTCLGVK